MAPNTDSGRRFAPKTSYLDGKVVFVTGGTGSFGRRFVRRVLAEAKPKKLIVYSRDELKQHEMLGELQEDFGPEKLSAMRFFL
ncbi:MAG: pseB, partial [Caulobacteraceae bacterium]|nr:pseB [Caulobacteraceae bacterium]